MKNNDPKHPSQKARLLSVGAYAVVFYMGNGTVVKAYLRRRMTRVAVGDWADHEAIIRAVWANEVRTYQRLASRPDLRVFVPEFVGPCDPLQVLPVQRIGTLRLMQGCGLRLERIHGTPTNWTTVDLELRPSVEGVLRHLIDTIQPGNVWGSACFVPGSRAAFTLIDFALWDRVNEFAEPLELRGRLSNRQRAELATLGTVDPSQADVGAKHA